MLEAGGDVGFEVTSEVPSSSGRGLDGGVGGFSTRLLNKNTRDHIPCIAFSTTFITLYQLSPISYISLYIK